MKPHPDGSMALFAFSAFLLCWSIFAAAFLFRKRPPGELERRRDPIALLGDRLIRGWRRSRHAPLLPPPGGETLDTVLPLSAPVLAAASACFVVDAALTLGRQWAVGTRVVEGHALIAPSISLSSAPPDLPRDVRQADRRRSGDTHIGGLRAGRTLVVREAPRTLRVEERLLSPPSLHSFHVFGMFIHP
jgi:hypothetical protein